MRKSLKILGLLALTSMIAMTACGKNGRTGETTAFLESGGALETEEGDGESLETEAEGEKGQEEVRELTPVKALLSGAAPYGTDGPQLFYYDEDFLYFYDYYGILIFQYHDRENFSDFRPGVVDSLDLSSLGCSGTQGDSAALVVASPDGKSIYFHAMDGDVMYEYQVEENRLFEKPVEEMPEKEDWFLLPEDMRGYLNQEGAPIDRDFITGEPIEETADRGYFRFEGNGFREETGVSGYCLQYLEFIMDSDMVIPIWTDGTREYMKGLKALYDEGSFQVSDNGWSLTEKVKELSTGEPSGWMNVTQQADENGDILKEGEERETYFLFREEGKEPVKIPARQYESLSYVDGDYLITRFQDKIQIAKPVKGQDGETSLGEPVLTVGAGGGSTALYRTRELLAVSDPSEAKSLTFYDGTFQKVREYRNVRVEADGYSEGLFCVMRLEDGLYGYVDEKGELSIPFQYSRAFPFKNGYAAVLCGAENHPYTEDGGKVPMFDSVGGEWGIIDRLGAFAVEPEEKYSNSFDRDDIPDMPRYVGGPVRFGEVDEDGNVDFYEVEGQKVLYTVKVKK